jgi:APA family basic amino acid/polyamine antiporter
MVIAGVVSALAGLCYAGVRARRAGRGLRVHLRLCHARRVVAWSIGWDLILEYALGAATVAVGWSGNVVSLLGRLRHPSPARDRERPAR